MAGIHQFYQGETGTVSETWWLAGEERLSYVIFIEGNRHRHLVTDYGSDIGIEPSVKNGDHVAYIRMNPWAGIWIQSNRVSGEDIENGEQAVIQHRKYMDEYGDILLSDPHYIEEWLESLYRKTGIPVYRTNRDQVIGADHKPDLEKGSKMPEPELSVFISYSNKNVLFARYFFEKIEMEGRAEAWFDRDQGGESKRHDREIENWLQSGVRESQVFALLLTKASAASEWVNKEINWALEQDKSRKDFHLILLKLDHVTVPEIVRGTDYVVDCKGLSQGEILEELYAAVYKRMGRLDWLSEHMPGKEDIAGKRERGNYDHLRSDSGIAVDLQWKKKDNRTYWVLYYKEKEHSRKIKQVTGEKENHVVDPGIKPGDKIGFYMFNPETPLWMRSEDMNLTPHMAYHDYLETLKSPPPEPDVSPEQSRFLREVMWTAGLGIIAASAAFFVWFIREYAGKLEQPAELSVEQFQWIQNANFILFLASVLIYGFYSLKYHGHPMQFSGRTAGRLKLYNIKALGVILLDTVVKPMMFFFGILLIYGIPAAILLQLLQTMLKKDLMMVFAYGHIGIYSIWILYILWRFWCLFVEGPDYVKSPSFIAGYTEGMGRPRRAKTKKKKPRKSPINFKVIRIKGHEFELKYLVKEIAAVVIGLWMLLTWGIGTVEGLIRKSWPTTQGIILTAKTETDTLYTDQKHVRLTYKYHVDGKQYMGKNIKADEGLPHKPEKAEELLRTTYRVSQPVTVYYKSKNPAVSVLEPGPEVYHYILSGLGIFFLYMGASIIYGSITDRIRREENT